MTETRSARQTVFRSRALSLHLDQVELADGRRAERHVVEHPGSVVLVPVHEGRVLLVRQFRYPVQTELLELPAGTLRPGEEPPAAGNRELAEETGYTAGELQPIAALYPSPGYATERMWIFLALDLSPAGNDASGDPDEEIEVVPLPLDEAVRRARGGAFDDMKTVAGILLAAERLGASGS
jgi:ADP-ribose pyrophosphatase